MKRLIYKTQRLVLATLIGKDSQKSLDFEIKNKAFFEKWESKKEDDFFTLSYQRQIINYHEKLLRTSQGIHFAIFLKEDEKMERIIGKISVSPIIWGNFSSCMIGYKLDEDFTNQGLMSEAINSITDFIFNYLKLHRIQISIMPDNISSIKMIEKLGFTYEGKSKEYIEVNGKFEDHLHYVKLSKK